MAKRHVNVEPERKDKKEEQQDEERKSSVESRTVREGFKDQKEAAWANKSKYGLENMSQHTALPCLVLTLELAGSINQPQPPDQRDAISELQSRLPLEFNEQSKLSHFPAPRTHLLHWGKEQSRSRACNTVQKQSQAARRQGHRICTKF